MRLVSDLTLLTIAVWAEARGEPFEGKVAVAEVILRRARTKYQSDGSVAGAIFRPWQFSAFNTTDPNRLYAFRIDDDDPTVKSCIEAVKMAMEGSDLTRGAVLYANLGVVRPSWQDRATETVTIGNHTFFTERQSTA